MALYAIGDVQGCFSELQALLARLRFDPARDRLWFTGDLVNRGPQSAAVLRYVRDLGERALTVLGNHDLHFLAVAAGAAQASRRDRLDDVLNAADRDELVSWLRQQPLLHHDRETGFTLVHAGWVPQWDLATALALAREAEATIGGPSAENFFSSMYGDEPSAWDPRLAGHARLRFIVNVFTRLRFCDAAGRLALAYKGAPGSQPSPYRPWFELVAQRQPHLRIVFGHWSLLGARRLGPHIALDSGCLWGRALTAVRLDEEDTEFVHVPCTAKLAPRDVSR